MPQSSADWHLQNTIDHLEAAIRSLRIVGSFPPDQLHPATINRWHSIRQKMVKMEASVRIPEVDPTAAPAD